MEDKRTPQYGPQYQSGRTRILHYGNDAHVLYLSVKLPDGTKRTDTFVLPDATPVPGECQLTSYGVMGRTAYGYEHLRHFILQFSCDGQDYYARYDVDDINPFQWFILPFFRPLEPYEVENLKKWGYRE